MIREIIETNDGSKTIRIIDLDENYHSGHGALQEALHVFIKNGFHAFPELNDLHIFEVGFGTGLNAFLTAVEAEKSEKKVFYTGIEAFPISEEEVQQLAYSKLLSNDVESLYSFIHQAQWENNVVISPFFEIKKTCQKIQDILLPNEQFDLIYFDAFGPRAQEEMWTPEIFSKMYKSLKSNGCLVTYCAKGQVKRDLKAQGFSIEALPGPPGKREMTRAWK